MVSEATALDLTDRKSLMASLPKGGIGAEIGVAEGCFSEVLLEVCKPKTLYLIDSWIHLTAEIYKEDSGNVSRECHDSKYAQVRRRFGTKPEVRILRAFSFNAANAFDDDFFDWIHLDADHTQTEKDMVAWWPKVKSGGWATGHDYTMAGKHITVKAAVDAFVAKHGLELFVTRGDTDVYEKNYPSWAVRKPQ